MFDNDGGEKFLFPFCYNQFAEKIAAPKKTPPYPQNHGDIQNKLVVTIALNSCSWQGRRGVQKKATWRRCLSTDICPVANLADFFFLLQTHVKNQTNYAFRKNWVEK